MAKKVTVHLKNGKRLEWKNVSADLVVYEASTIGVVGKNLATGSRTWYPPREVDRVEVQK